MPEKDKKEKQQTPEEKIGRFIYSKEDLQQILASNGLKAENKVNFSIKKLTEFSKKLSK